MTKQDPLSDFTQSVWSPATAVLKSDFEGSTFAGLDLRGVEFTGARVEHANLTRADLSGASLKEASLVHSDLRGARCGCARPRVFPQPRPARRLGAALAGLTAPI